MRDLYAGSQRIAVRENGTLSWLLSDHLGSTSLVTTSAGALSAEFRYMPFGETRYEAGIAPTDYQYTGQRAEDLLGFYFYRARWYDPALGRFIQADTIGGGDRYIYVGNNPLRFVDPSGHVPSCRLLGEDCLDPYFGAVQREHAYPIPEWNMDYQDCLSAAARHSAELAFRHFQHDPTHFIEAYVNPPLRDTEYADLEVFAMYSELGMSSADALIWNTVASAYGIDAANVLSEAQLNNIQLSWLGEDAQSAVLVLAAFLFAPGFAADEEAMIANAIAMTGRDFGNLTFWRADAGSTRWAANATLGQPHITIHDPFFSLTIDQQAAILNEELSHTLQSAPGGISKAIVGALEDEAQGR